MGERIGKYELLSRIASGGMAEIHVARATSLPGVEKVVVIKRLLPQHQKQADFIEMFLDEARIAASLNHPNIVQMYDFGPADDSYFMAMEYLHGEDLRTIQRLILSQKKLVPLSHALTIVAAICSALHHAHEARAMDGTALQIVHRDVSPHNVFVTFDGAVKLVDFGIAKSKNRASETRHGTIKGKVPYMAPEQLRAETLDRRCDIYAMGVMLYELTTGMRPYVLSAAGEFALMMAIARGQIRPPSELRPDYPPELAEIVMKALAKKPENRFQTAREMSVAIEKFASSARLNLSTSDLSGFMHDLFGEKLARWQQDQAQGKGFADHVIEIEKAKREGSPGEDAEVVDTTQLGFQANWENSEDSSRTASTTTSGLAGMVIPGVELNARRVGNVDIVSFAGRLSETFTGAAVGAALRGIVVLDLAHVERISSFGVREWLAMLDAAREHVQELYLARLSEAAATQMGMIRSFAGGGRLTSFYAPYLCDACGKSARRLIDCERDAEAIRSRNAPPGVCPSCRSATNLDDDPSYFAFAASHAGVAIPEHVRAALDALTDDAPTVGEVLEKVVQGNVTRLRVRSPLDRSIRWNRALDGLEGAVVIEFQSSVVAPEAAANLAQALRSVGPEVTGIDLVSCPLIVLEAAASVTAKSSRIRISSILVEASCPSCNAMRSALVNTAELGADVAAGSLLRLPCRRCNAPLSVQPDTIRRLKAALDHTSSPPPASSRIEGPPSSQVVRPIPFEPGKVVIASTGRTTSNKVVIPLIGAGILVSTLLLVGGAFVVSKVRANPRPGPGTSAAITGESLPPWTDTPVVREKGNVLLVGKSGVVQSESEGLAMAQADAVRTLATLVLSEMNASDARGFVPILQGDPSHAPAPDELRALSERFLNTVGATSTPERMEAIVRPAPQGIMIYARYSLPERGLASAVLAYSKTVRAGGATFANLFPLVGAKEAPTSTVMVVAVDERAQRSGVAPGDIVVKVEDRVVTSLDHFNAMTVKTKSFALLLKNDKGEPKRAQLTR